MSGAEPPPRTPERISNPLGGVEAVGDAQHRGQNLDALDPAMSDTVGVSFGAKWIAAMWRWQSPNYRQLFDADVIGAFQWAADPDGDALSYTWDFGDGSRTVTSKSDGNVDSHAADGYAVVTHRYQVPGQYLVRVHRTDRLGRRLGEHLMQRAEQEVMHQAALTEADLVLGRVDVDVDQRGRDLEEQHVGRVAAMVEHVLVGLPHRMRDQLVAHHAPVHVEMLHVGLAA